LAAFFLLIVDHLLCPATGLDLLVRREGVGVVHFRNSLHLPKYNGITPPLQCGASIASSWGREDGSMMGAGKTAVWIGNGVAILGVVACVALCISYPADWSPASLLPSAAPLIVSAVLFLSGLILILVGIRSELRRRDRIEAGLRENERLLRDALS